MKKLLITGYMRSGTTLLSNFLNSQEGCLIYRDFLQTIFRTSKELGIKSFKSKLGKRQKNVLLSELKSESWVIGSNMYDQLTTDFENLLDLYVNSVMILKGDKEFEVVGTKVTALSDWLPILVNETDVYVIYIYRDIRDVLLSAKNAFPWYNLSRVLIEAQNDVKIAKKIENKSKTFLMLSFEDLILQTEPTLERIAKFLQIEVHKDIPVAKDRKMNWVNNSSFHDLDRLFDSRACFRWKKSAESKEVKYCEIMAGRFLLEMGYPITTIYGFSDTFRSLGGFYFFSIIHYTKQFLLNLNRRMYGSAE